MSSPPNAYQAKFTGLEFAAGSLRGVRVWTIQPTFSQRDGHRLVGSYHGVWHEGENHAKCLVNQNRLPTSEQREPCTLVEPSCQCGFYAYWTWRPKDYGYTAFYYAPYVAGVIEGYGKTVMGDLGFRCEKARILALAPVRPAWMSPDMLRNRMLALRRVINDRHPGVPLFESIDAMLAAFPPDDPPEGAGGGGSSGHLDPGAVAAVLAAAGLIGGVAALGAGIERALRKLRRR